MSMLNPLRREAGKPTLRQRAEALKASAARVIRGQKKPAPIPATPAPDPEPVDWHNPPPGFMAYPAVEPTGFIIIREGLRLEARRLLNIAEDEFERRAEHDDPCHQAFREGDLARLRRRLRLDELRAAAEPEVPVPAGSVDSTGTVYYEDAAGNAFRQPVAHWIAFTAQRLHGLAQSELSRQFNAGCQPGDEAGNRALDARLRRELRTDALFALAFKSRKVFDAAEAERYGADGETAATQDSQAREQAHEIDLYDCSTRSLANLYEAFDAKADAWSAASCQPYAEADKAANRVLDDEYQRAAIVRDRIVGLLREREPKEEWERDAILQAEIQFEMKCEGAIRDPDLIARITAAWGA